jgi:hypothetical protein
MQPLQKSGGLRCACHLVLQCATFMVETQAEGFASLQCPIPSDLADALDARASTRLDHAPASHCSSTRLVAARARRPAVGRQLAEVRVKRMHPPLENRQALHSTSCAKHPDYFFRFQHFSPTSLTSRSNSNDMNMPRSQ